MTTVVSLIPYSWNRLYRKSQQLMRSFRIWLCLDVVWQWFYPYTSGLLHWRWDNLSIATMPVKQAWRIWVNGSLESAMNPWYDHNKTKPNKPVYTLYWPYQVVQGSWRHPHSMQISLRATTCIQGTCVPIPGQYHGWLYDQGPVSI